MKRTITYDPATHALVPMRIKRDMIEAAAEAHYGKDCVGARGIDMAVNGVNYNFAEAMRRFWKGAIAAAPEPVQAVGQQADEAPELINIGSMMYQGRTVTDWVITCKGLLGKVDEALEAAARSLERTMSRRDMVDIGWVIDGLRERKGQSLPQLTADEAQGAVAWMIWDAFNNKPLKTVYSATEAAEYATQHVRPMAYAAQPTAEEVMGGVGPHHPVCDRKFPTLCEGCLAEAAAQHAQP